MSKQFTLGKQERLKSRKLIEKVFREGKSFSLFPFRVYYLRTFPIPHPAFTGLQFGVGVSKKNFNKAVDRNRIKRLTRESYRLQKKLVEEKIKGKNKNLALFFIYTAKELPSYPVVYEKMLVILKKMISIAEEKDALPA